MRLQPRHDSVLVRIDRYEDYRTPVSAVIVPAEAQIDDVTGVVEAVGPEVTAYQAGDHVLFAAPIGEAFEPFYDEKWRLIPQDLVLGTYTPEGV